MCGVGKAKRAERSVCLDLSLHKGKESKGVFKN